ncbi:MAG: outer membrane beta-barrel protein [Vicinamibacteraceae bacterium]
MRTLVVFLLLAVVSSAQAQGAPPRGTVAGVVGAGQTWDDEGSLGKGMVVGGRLDWRLFGSTSVEVAVDRLAHERSGEFFEAEGGSVMVGVSLLHRFSGARAQPYVLAGVDLVRHSGTVRFDAMAIPRESTDGGVHVGAGLAVAISERVEVGPEGRFCVLNAENNVDPAWA